MPAQDRIPEPRTKVSSASTEHFVHFRDRPTVHSHVDRWTVSSYSYLRTDGLVPVSRGIGFYFSLMNTSK